MTCTQQAGHKQAGSPPPPPTPIRYRLTTAAAACTLLQLHTETAVQAVCSCSLALSLSGTRICALSQDYAQPAENQETNDVKTREPPGADVVQAMQPAGKAATRSTHAHTHAEQGQRQVSLSTKRQRSSPLSLSCGRGAPMHTAPTQPLCNDPMHMHCSDACFTWVIAAQRDMRKEAGTWRAPCPMLHGCDMQGSRVRRTN